VLTFATEYFFPLRTTLTESGLANTQAELMRSCWDFGIGGLDVSQMFTTN